MRAQAQPNRDGRSHQALLFHIFGIRDSADLATLDALSQTPPPVFGEELP
jgi:hypothetical protein